MQTPKSSNKTYFQLIRADLFLLGLFILLLNDFYLKRNFSGILTGKLSDFAGLFIFPYFFSVFYPNKKLKIYIATVLLFIFWKLPLADGLINWFNSLGLLHLYRVKDITDCIALLILPFSFSYFDRQKQKLHPVRFIQVSFFSALALFSFCATTVGYEHFPAKLPIRKDYILSTTKQDLLQRFSGHLDQEQNLNDTTFYLSCSPLDKPEVTITFSASIKEGNNNIAKIHVDSIVNYSLRNEGLFNGPNKNTMGYFKTLPASEFEKILDDNFRSLLARNVQKETIIWYDNKPLIDSLASISIDSL